jgi:hypothetical protein
MQFMEEFMCKAYLSSLKLEAVESFETWLPLYQPAECSTSDDHKENITKYSREIFLQKERRLKTS